jgi:hypothetical protein
LALTGAIANKQATVGRQSASLNVFANRVSHPPFFNNPKTPRPSQCLLAPANHSLTDLYNDRHPAQRWPPNIRSSQPTTTTTIIIINALNTINTTKPPYYRDPTTTPPNTTITITTTTTTPPQHQQYMQ